MADLQVISFEEGWERIQQTFKKLCDILDRLYNDEEVPSNKFIPPREHSEIYT